MDTENGHSLALNGALLFIILSEGILLAPHLESSLLSFVPKSLGTDMGVAFYVLGVAAIMSVLLNYTRRQKAWVRLADSIALVILGLLYYRAGFIVEAGVTLALAIGFLSLIHFENDKVDWLTEVIQVTNLLIGVLLIVSRDIFVSIGPYSLFQPVELTFAVLFLLSGITSIFIDLTKWKEPHRQAQALALPWLLWGVIFLAPLELPGLLVSWSVAFSLLLKDIIPWNKLILREGTYLGRRFFDLVGLANGALLILLVWLIRIFQANIPASDPVLTQVQEILFVFYIVLFLFGNLLLAYVHLSINGIFSGLNGEGANPPEEKITPASWLKQIVLEPYTISRKILHDQYLQRAEYEKLLARQLIVEKRRMAQLNLLHTLNTELENVLDPPVSAQLTANAISSALPTSLVVVLDYEADRAEMVTTASSGPKAGIIPPGYRQSIHKGLVGRTARLRKTQVVSDTRLDTDFISFDGLNSLSEVVVPMLYQNRLMGEIVVDYPHPHAFDDSDLRTLETVALQLVTAWNRSEHDQRLTNLVEAGIALSTTLEIEPVIKQIAEVARETLDARFVFVALADKGGGFTRTAYVGYAPTLLSILNSDPSGNVLIQTVLDSASAFRLRDVRKRFRGTPTGSNDLRSLLAAPIRLRQSSIGAILAFGKQGNVNFSESDEALVSLLATQAAASIETSWLYQELRSMLNTATQLYQLSIHVIQAEELTSAAAAIAETTYQVTRAQAAGIVLFTPSSEVEARVQIDSSGLHPGAQHPMNLVHQAMETGQTIILSGVSESARACIPLQTPRRQYGALWVEISESNWSNARFTDNFLTLANQAAIALERSILLVETRRQADEIERAYRELEITYDRTLAALSSALDARDRETEGHSLRVARVAYYLGIRMGLSQEQAKTLERGAILHDIGKIGVSDSILLKPGALSTDEWLIMRQHPDIGARIIEGIPFLKDALPVIRYHQERWDGSGYPIGLKGTDIPFMARIFAVVDAFDALTTDRPYRTRVSFDEALSYIQTQAGILFDPEVVDAFNEIVIEGMVGTLFNIT